MKNRQLGATFRLAFLIFVCYILASAITFSVVAILIACNVDIGAWGLLVLILLVLFSCTIIAFTMTFIRIKGTAKAMNDIKAFCGDIANGNFGARLNIKSKEPIFTEVAENLNTVAAELNSVAILKNDFVRNFSHEFKTPIVSIKGFSELLCKDKTISEEEKEKYYRIIRDESERLANLANTTLLLSKLDSQSVAVEKENFYIDEQIEECAMLLADEVEKKNLNAKIDLDHFVCHGSRELLKEVWLNLLSNAIKFTDENGHIKIFSYQTPTGYAICFQDDGIGISDEDKKHIFDEYFQADGRKNKGIGLGLSVVKRILSLHGLEIFVTPAVGQGSAFTILINTI